MAYNPDGYSEPPDPVRFPDASGEFPPPFYLLRYRHCDIEWIMVDSDADHSDRCIICDELVLPCEIEVLHDDDDL